MPTPRTSFVIPVRDGAATLDAAIRSVVAQQDPDFELILVDDGSRDDTWRVIDAWRRRDQRLRAHRIPRSGVAAAAHEGLLRSRGRYVARLDADDIASPDRLVRQIPLLEADSRLTVVDGRMLLFRDGDEVPQGMRLYQDWINHVVTPADFDRELLVDSPVVNPASTARRIAMLDAGGLRDGPFPEDYDLWLRMHSRGAVFRKVEATLVHMRDRPDRLTRTDHRFSRDAFRRARFAWLRRGPLATRRRVALWGGRKESRPWLRWLLSTQDVRAMIDIDPRKVGARRQGDVPVLAPDALRDLDVDLCLVAVAARGARDQIRDAMRALRPDWREGRDWWAVR